MGSKLVRMPQCLLWAIHIACVLVLAPGCAQAAAQLEICVRQDSLTDRDDFDAAFEHGPVMLPAGVVFDLAGHTFGGASDPLDGKHMRPGAGVGWTGISKEEGERRSKVMLEDTGRNQRRTSGLVTTSAVRLTKARPCALAPVAAVASAAWGWTVAPIFGDPNIYYQTYGVVHDGKLNTDWTKEPAGYGTPALGGALNGVLRGTTERVINILE